jgi:hypothetical protein
LPCLSTSIHAALPAAILPYPSRSDSVFAPSSHCGGVCRADAPMAAVIDRNFHASIGCLLAQSRNTAPTAATILIQAIWSALSGIGKDDT